MSEIDELYKRTLATFGAPAQLLRTAQAAGELIENIFNPLANGTPMGLGLDLTIMLHQLTVLTGHTVAEYEAGPVQRTPAVLSSDLGRLVKSVILYHQGKLKDHQLWAVVRGLVIMNIRHVKEQEMIEQRQRDLKFLLDLEDKKVLKLN